MAQNAPAGALAENPRALTAGKVRTVDDETSNRKGRILYYNPLYILNLCPQDMHTALPEGEYDRLRYQESHAGHPHESTEKP